MFAAIADETQTQYRGQGCRLRGIPSADGPDVEDGIQGHEAAMTRMGFLFLGIFIAVIVVAAILP